MSPLTVTLTMANGPLVGQEYEFREPAVYVLGRAAECYPRLPDELPYKDISRHHCLPSINLPEVRVLDLGSTNGTFVNGAKVGQPAGPPSRSGTRRRKACSERGRRNPASLSELRSRPRVLVRTDLRVRHYDGEPGRAGSELPRSRVASRPPLRPPAAPSGQVWTGGERVSGPYPAGGCPARGARASRTARLP
jgi:pSer/pThr/pTyr-binding forkhead associated (FHA) protein